LGSRTNFLSSLTASPAATAISFTKVTQLWVSML
jgi:hypothetical protein